MLLSAEDTQIGKSDLERPLVMDSDFKSLSSKEEGIHFYCRSCSTRLTKIPIRHFVEMPSVNWQEAADNWFGGCCCSFGGISEKLVTRYANSYICAADMCLLTHTTVTLFKDDLVGCKFPDLDDVQKYKPGLNFVGEDGLSESTPDSGSNLGRMPGCDSQSDIIHDLNGKFSFMCLKNENFSGNLESEVNEEENNDDNLFCANVASVPGCCAHTTCEILDHVDKACGHTVSESSPLDQNTKRTMKLMTDQRSFLNGFLGNFFMARSSSLSRDVEWIEFLCPKCSSLLGAYPCSNGDAPIGGGVRLLKSYISTSLPVGGLDDIFRKYTLERMFTNQLLESAEAELSFRSVVRDLKTKSPRLQLVLINPNSWCCTGYCLGTESTMEPISKLDLLPIVKVQFSDCTNNSESELRTLEDWLTKNLADEVFMLTRQIEELIGFLALSKDILPPSCTSIQGLHLSSMRR